MSARESRIGADALRERYRAAGQLAQHPFDPQLNRAGAVTIAELVADFEAHAE